MEAIEQIISAEALGAVIDIPPTWKSVRVIALPVETLEKPDEEDAGQKQETMTDRIAKFRAKHTPEMFREHLRNKLAEGVKFDWDVEKYLLGNWTEEDEQNFIKVCKQAWPEAAGEKAKQRDL